MICLRSYNFSFSPTFERINGVREHSKLAEIQVARPIAELYDYVMLREPG